jgi:hypothetical protein
LPIFSEWFLFLTLLYGLSIVTSKFIERPMRSRLAKITPVIFGVLGTLSLLFLLQSADGLREKYPKPMLGLVQPVASTWLDDVRIGTCLLQDKVAKFHKAECSASQEDEIMVWGDSHAASLVSWAMMESNAKNKSRISQLTQAGCPPLLELRTLIYRENCNQINQRILERIRSTHPETIVLAAAWKHPDYPLTLTDLAKKLDYTLDLIGKNSPKSKVIVVGPAPWWLDSAQEDSISRSGNILSGYTPADRYIVATQFTDVEHLLSRVSANNRVSYFSTIDSLCLGTKCLARDPAGHFTSADRSHLSRFGSKIVWQGIVSKFHFY